MQRTYPTMDIVATLCIKCNSELGRFRNSWNGIGNTYHSPVYPPLSVSGLETTGDVYNGAANSAIEHSQLQDIACEACHTVVGLRCDSAPEGHLLKENQLILRLTDMSVVSDTSGQKAKISVLKSFPLMITPGKRLSGARRATTAQPSPRAPLAVLNTPVTTHQPSPRARSTVLNTTVSAHQNSNSGKLSADNRVSMVPVQAPLSEMARFKEWAEDAIKTQRKDIDRISGTVDRVERDLQALKDFMLEVRADLSSHRQLPHISEHDILNLRDDLDGLRQKVEQNGQTLLRGSNEVSQARIAVIAQDVNELGRKVHEVEHFRTDIEKMQARIDFLEDTRRLALPAKGPTTELEHLHEPVPVASKRKHEELGELRSPSEERLVDPVLPKRRRLARVSSPDTEIADSFGHSEKISSDGQLHLARDVVEIFSSEYDPSSPVRQRNSQYNHNYEDTVGNADALTPVSVASAPVSRSSNSNRAVVSSMQTCAAPTGSNSASHQMVNRESTSRIEVRVPYMTASTLRKQQPHIRDARGVLLRPNGRVDGRSLRFRAIPEDRDNATPTRPGGDCVEFGSQKANGSDVILGGGADDHYTPAPTTKVSRRSIHLNKGGGDLTNVTPAQPDDDELGDNYEISNDTDVIFSSKPDVVCTPTTAIRLAGFQVSTPATGLLKSGSSTSHRPKTDPGKKKPYKCGGCGRAYQKTQGLDYHHAHSKGSCAKNDKDNHNREFVCGKCGKSYSVYQGLEYHEKYSNCNPNPRPPMSPMNPYTCNLCSKDFTSAPAYFGHICLRVAVKSRNSKIGQREGTVAANGTKLVEREKLVRETLERELGN